MHAREAARLAEAREVGGDVDPHAVDAVDAVPVGAGRDGGVRQVARVVDVDGDPGDQPSGSQQRHRRPRQVEAGLLAVRRRLQGGRDDEQRRQRTGGDPAPEQAARALQGEASRDGGQPEVQPGQERTGSSPRPAVPVPRRTWWTTSGTASSASATAAATATAATGRWTPSVR